MLIKYRYRIQEPEKLTNNVSLSNEKKIYKHSWCVRVRTRWNPSRLTRRNPVRLTRLNPSKTRSDLLEHVSSRPNELFPIFIFLYFLPPPLPPQFPHILFLFLFWGGEGRGTGRGGERAGDGDGTGGEPPPPPPAGRSVAPPSEGGGGQSPPPPSPSNKKQTNKIYKSNDISTLDNSIL